MRKADFIFKEIDPPDDLWCESGHYAPSAFKRGGPDSEPMPIRFWHAKGIGFNKCICEPCLILVNYVARIKRKKQKEVK